MDKASSKSLAVRGSTVQISSFVKSNRKERSREVIMYSLLEFRGNFFKYWNVSGVNSGVNT